MHFTAILLVASSALAGKAYLTPDVLKPWSALKTGATAVADKDCSGEIVDAFSLAEKAYADFGLSQQFVDAVASIKEVAGDIPESDKFRANLWAVRQKIATSYKAIQPLPAPTTTNGTAASANGYSTPTGTPGNSSAPGEGGFGTLSGSNANTVGLLSLSIAVVASILM
jgi:hypothetical protein